MKTEKKTALVSVNEFCFVFFGEKTFDNLDRLPENRFNLIVEAVFCFTIS